MKKYIILILAVFLILQGYSDSHAQQTKSGFMKLASWNIRIFSDGSRTDEELRQICKVAKNFDFISIVELRDEVVLQRMVNMLKDEFGKDYGYEVSDYVGNTRSEEYIRLLMESNLDTRGARELYAFVYDKSKISCKIPVQLYYDDTFFRYPCFATFKAGNFDFTIISIHVIWGSSVSDRRREINRLQYVYDDLQNRDPNENDIILVGDFNRDPDDDLSWGPLHSLQSMVHLFNEPLKSMIWDSHLYDNILFQKNYVAEHYDCNGNSYGTGIIKFDETDFGNDDKAASAAVSDHRPVWALFQINNPDDD